MKRELLPLLLAGLVATIVVTFPVIQHTFGEIIFTFSVVTLLLYICDLCGKKVAQDFELSGILAYIVSFAIAILVVFAAAFLWYPNDLSENGRVLMANGRMTFTGVLITGRDAVLIGSSVFLYGGVRRLFSRDKLR